jgi:hypothetical protein
VHVVWKRFEVFVLLAEPHWPVWVPSAASEQPLKITYRRLHHRYKFVIVFSKKSQEKATIKFKQTIINYSVIKLAMLEAQSVGFI